MQYEFQKLMNNSNTNEERKCKNENNISNKKYNYN